MAINYLPGPGAGASLISALIGPDLANMAAQNQESGLNAEGAKGMADLAKAMIKAKQLADWKKRMKVQDPLEWIQTGVSPSGAGVDPGTATADVTLPPGQYA